jgi:hypothetical protein
MPAYIRAYDQNNRQLPGNSRGWAVIRHKRPETNSAWKVLEGGSAMYPDVKFWAITKPGVDGFLAVHSNPHHVPTKESEQ